MSEGQDNPGVIAPPPLIALATLLLGLLLDWLMPAYVLGAVFIMSTRIFLGAVLAIAGAGLAVIGERTFRFTGTNVAPWQPALKLATIGIYRYMRNPMYVGLVLLTAGLGVMLESDWTLILLVPAVVLLHWGVVLREERYLERKFGDDYRRYKERVPRYGWPT